MVLGPAGMTSIPQAGAPVMVASPSASIAAAMQAAALPQPVLAPGLAAPPGATQLVTAMGPLGRPVLMRQVTPGMLNPIECAIILNSLNLL